jgi:membrane-bound ClpP family serine protease
MEQGYSILLLLYAMGLLLLLADFFLPSHGVLTAASFALLGYALYLTFQVSQRAGVIALVALAVVVPIMIAVAVKQWHRTPIGRRISPPNPVLTESDRMPVEDLQRLVGTVGRTLTPLRPVGTCLFDGRRIECVAEYGMIAAHVEVRGLRLSDRSLAVRPVDSEESGIS